MSKTSKKRRYPTTSIKIDGNIRVQRVYPVENTRKKTIQDLKTVGMKLSRDQAIHLARVLLAVSQEWDKIEIKAKRFDKRRDGTYSVTVTSLQ